ncbi:hypothetical protein Q5O14_15040 [Eubacteriaceae bacterium ES2]|nr:hypothetical protein Q5O14_15040 [Eubacteriaceae bacterium ES2]
MDTFDKYTTDIRNTHLGMLLDQVEDRDSHRDLPEFCDAANELWETFNSLTIDKETRQQLEWLLDAVSYTARYQGFTSGFHEAVGLLTGGVK